MKFSYHGLHQHYKAGTFINLIVPRSQPEESGERIVSGRAKLPSNFRDSLQDSKNKQELSEFLTQKVSDKKLPFQQSTLHYHTIPYNCHQGSRHPHKHLPYDEKFSRTNIFMKFTTEEQFVKNTVNEKMFGKGSISRKC